MIDNIKELIDSIGYIYENQLSKNFIFKYNRYEVNKGDLYCPKCGGIRKMEISYSACSYLNNDNSNFSLPMDLTIKDAYLYLGNKFVNSIFIYKCSQECGTIFTVLIYSGTNGTELAILANCPGGVVTPHTPSSVVYYLDQAHRAKSIGANSACMAMYRAALDQILYDQGYTVDKMMLGSKINKLEDDINKRAAKKWAYDLDTDFLKYLKDLGNSSIHTNDGNTEKQATIDSELLYNVDEVFIELLDLIYEEDYRKQKRKDLFKLKQNIFNSTT